MSDKYYDIEVPAERLRKFVRINQPGACKMLSKGDGCLCPLCDIDRLVRLAYRGANNSKPVHDVEETKVMHMPHPPETDL